MATVQQPQRVSAADFIRGFANWRLQAAREPVVVTHHGKDAHVLISLDDYRRLDGDGTSPADEIRDSLAALVTSIRDGVIVIDRQRRIAALNPAAHDMFDQPAATLLGQDISVAMPGLPNSLLFRHVGRLLDHRERFSGEVPGLLGTRQWLRVDLAPVPAGGAIILRDVSAAMHDAAADDARRALVAAIEADGGIGHVRISVREAVEHASDALLDMLGVDLVAIRRVRFSALLAMGQRAAFTDALETLFRGGAPVRIASELVTREGKAIAVTLSIAERRGAYASDGAVVVVTSRAAS